MGKYSDEYKADAVARMAAEGYPDKDAAAERVIAQLEGIYGFAPVARTLKRWAKNDVGAPPDKVVTRKKDELADQFESIAKRYLTRAGALDAISETKGKDAITAAAIAVDKMRLLRNLPTEIVGVIPDISNAVEKSGETLEQVMPVLAELLSLLAENGLSPEQTMQRLIFRIQSRQPSAN